ncbi:MAG: hypothetical protein AMXMBFR51_20990 [Ignavibacteriota bacterium]
MEYYSNIEHSFENFIETVERNKALKTSAPFAPKDLTEEAKTNRINKATKDFWYFDKIYFPEHYYENYAPPNKMLKDIVNAADRTGCHLFIGPRKHGKTVTAKKLLIWLTITGKIKIAAVYSETLTKSAAILKDIYKLCINNDRLIYDFNLEFHEANSDSLSFTTNYPSHSTHYIASFSEGRSLRGYTRLFGRPEFLLADDIETLESSFSNNSVQLRIQKLFESYNSLNESGKFIILANDFNTASAVHQLRLQFDAGLLDSNWNVYVYKAWDKNKPLWKERYNAKTESHLQKILKPASQADWQANYQQNPIPPEGFFFLRDYYNTYSSLPKDIKAVLYCDPNLSKKNKGNTTAITVLGYSPSTHCYYIVDAVCKSFSDSNQLLDTVFSLKNSYKQIYAIAFDGNVTQESTWSQFARNWAEINKTPYPIIEYKRYKVNELAKNVQLVYAQGKLLFPDTFAKSDDGIRYLNQLFAFTGVKDSGLDDAPDSLICAFEFLHERKMISLPKQVKVFKDYYF